MSDEQANRPADREEADREHVGAGSEISVPGDAVLAEELAAEQSLWRTMLVGMAIATPICIVVWMLIVIFAVGPEDPAHWLAWLGMGAIVGTLAGAFFGGWAGFIKKAHVLDEVDARGARR